MNNEIKILAKKYWPESINELPKRDIPKILRIRGNSPNWRQKRICIVGSRKYSDYGESVCKKLVEEISGWPITIVSGLAYGIDSISHRAAIENNMGIIAVPGSGLDDNVIYPKRHLDLADNILKSGGCLISEYENNQPAAVWTFPQRNRIMAGLSDLVVIIEASEKSGTMITARLALDYNIDVACVPGSIFNDNSKGTNKLLKEGAHPITCGQDILNLLGINTNEALSKNDTQSNSHQKKLFLSEKHQHVLNLLKNSLSKEDLFDKAQLTIRELNEVLSELEIEGLIHIIDGKICQK